MPDVKPDSTETCGLLEQLGHGDGQALDRLLERYRPGLLEVRRLPSGAGAAGAAGSVRRRSGGANGRGPAYQGLSAPPAHAVSHVSQENRL
jgi:hypothetical protein